MCSRSRVEKQRGFKNRRRLDGNGFVHGSSDGSRCVSPWSSVHLRWLGTYGWLHSAVLGRLGVNDERLWVKGEQGECRRLNMKEKTRVGDALINVDGVEHRRRRSSRAPLGIRVEADKNAGACSGGFSGGLLVKALSCLLFCNDLKTCTHALREIGHKLMGELLFCSI